MDTKAIKIRTSDVDVSSIAFASDNSSLFGGQLTGNLGLHRWRVDDGEQFRLPQTRGKTYAVAASMNGRWIVTASSGKKICIMDAASHQIVAQISEHGSRINAIDVSNDSTRIASGSVDRTVRIFHVVSGVRAIVPLRHDDAVIGVKFSPDGSRIATATCCERPVVRVYDAHSGIKLLDIPAHVTSVQTSPGPLAWSSDGQQLFVVSPGKITRLVTSTSSCSEWPIQNDNTNVSIVTHDQYIACSAGSSLSLWDYASQTQIGSTIDHTSAIKCIAISHDGKYFACARSGEIIIHSLSDFLPPKCLPVVPPIPLMKLSDAVYRSWVYGNASETESILSAEIAQYSQPSHHALATRSLIRARLKEWTTAIEDAEMSLQIEQSPIGQIAKSLALIGAGKRESALDDFDFAFRDSDRNDNMPLLVIKCILMFLCGEHQQAVSRLHRLVTTSDPKTKDLYIPVLAYMYFMQGAYKRVIDTLKLATTPSTSTYVAPLAVISLIFNWNLDNLKNIASQRFCESLYDSGRIQQLGEVLLDMVSPLTEDEKETTHGRILEDIVTRSGQVTLLAWTGKSSTCNSCLPSSPVVYNQRPTTHLRLEGEALAKRTEELRAAFPFLDAVMTYARVTGSQPVRFANFRLLLPCIVFHITHLEKEQENVYRAETVGLGDVTFSTTDVLPLEEPRKLVFADLRLHEFLEPPSASIPFGLEDTTRLKADDTVSSVSDVGTTGSAAEVDLEVVPDTSVIIEEVSPPAAGIATRALQLIAHIGQSFSALLLLRHQDGTYRRVAADQEIVVGGMGTNIPEDIRVEVLEIL